MNYNLCQLTDEQRQLAAIDTEVCYWLWLALAGRVLRTDIEKALRAMDEAKSKLYRDRLNHWRGSFKPTPANAKRFADISESTWGRLINSFKKQTARFGG
ncbi:hypothetical protein [Arsukibacterium indicum]|uniref:Uncharacterized protein n=1 Tax=Arsukibacterium indicum TaxID=2848612 RepID=A0ABS6MH94_9GAMM|nr:hypothetical protein [Arsukibacterium indicum]MBV2128181.1 hypothetical protein [Arsukibacterium indicum]